MNSVASPKRQQRDIARLFDGGGKPPLVRCADAGQPPRHDLAAFGDELAEQPRVFVVDGVNFLDAEFADFLATKIFASAFTSPAGPTPARSAAITAARATLSAAISMP